MRDWTKIACLLLVAGGGVGGCGGDFNDSYNYVTGLRLLTIQAEPPEAAAGDTVALTALVVETGGGTIHLDWAACTLAPIPGTGTINQQCLTNDSAPYLVSFGQGVMVMGAVPSTVTPEGLGPPDNTGGFYLPIRARVTSGAQSVDGIYHLRYALGHGLPPNHNPKLDQIHLLTEAADMSVTSVTPLDDKKAQAVATGAKLILRASFTGDSTESYAMPVFDQTGWTGQVNQATEHLTVTWFSSAGQFSNGTTDPEVTTTLDLARRPPATGSDVTVWAVGHDDRGGTAFTSRTLHVQ